MKFSSHILRLSRALILASLIIFFSVRVGMVWAADATSDSLAKVGAETGLTAEDPKIIVGNLIRAGLGVIGIVLVCVIVYGGFVWMTAGGSAEKIEKAKKILINAVVGLIIVLLSWSIASFVISSLLGATDGSSGGSSGGSSSASSSLGGGSSSTFEVTGFSPEGAVSIRNIVPRITFSKAVDADTIEGNIEILDVNGTAVTGTFKVSGNVVKFTPDTACPAPNEDRFCFAENASYTVNVDTDILSTAGLELECTDESPCKTSFTSGTVVDTEDPSVTVTYPEERQNIASASTVKMQASATDDGGISGADFLVDDVWQDSLPADGNPTSTDFSTTVSTESFVDGDYYTLEVTVTDLADNEDTDSVTVRARPLMCFNGLMNEDNGETGPDCGGDSSSATYCGACDDASCTEDSDCSSGSCVDNVCVSNPSISAISPEAGAVGTFVTLSGTDFGNYTGTVWFTNEAGTGLIEADVLDCGGGWTDTQVVVGVPDGAGDGPITLITAADLSDVTDDDNGIAVHNFDVNTTVYPSLCRLSRSSGPATVALTVSGANFGATRGSSTVNFDAVEAGSYTAWSDAAASVTVPSTASGTYNVSLTENGLTSNVLAFEITDAVVDASTISGISPASGGIDQYVTITGTNFGTSIGTVTLTSTSGDTATASIDFPEACVDRFWDTDEVTVIIPAKFNNGNALTTGDYQVTVTNLDGVTSSSIPFTVTDAEPTPGICAIDPETVEIGDEIAIFGDHFGNDVDVVTFYNGIPSVAATTWTNDEITIPVPTGAVTGPLSVTVAGVESNTVNVAIGEVASVVAATGVKAAYAWVFSTGKILDVPDVVRECSDATISAVPNGIFSQSADICVNAVVYAEFTTLMNEATVEDAVTVRRCNAAVSSATDDPCATTEVVAGKAQVSSSTTATRVTWVPDSDFATNSTYQVTIAATATSVDAIPMATAETWEFTTSTSTEQCVVDRVTVTPALETLSEDGETAGFAANAGTGCVVVDSADYTWDWSVDKYSFVDFNVTANDECVGDPTACATLEALAEGITMLTATAINANNQGSVSDAASVTVNFSDPYILDYWPNCTEACTNAEVSATFNTAMDVGDVTTENHVVLYQCANELCNGLTLTAANPDCVYDVNDATRCTGFVFPDQLLEAGSYYRVLVSGDIQSTSGVPLIRTNYGSDYSWTFRVRDDATACAVERITLLPDDVVVNEIGNQTAFSAQAYGGADTCSVSGQPLAGDAYNWSWTDPIPDADQNNSTEKDTAAWYTISSALLDGGASAITEGCSALCTPIGSSSYQAVCGDGVLDQESDGSGEECDDGNTTDHDGCSSTCLYEGSFACSFVCSLSLLSCSTHEQCAETCDTSSSTCTISGNTCTTDSDCAYASSTCMTIQVGCCGNGKREISGDIAEDCDDGNLVDGDGCSSSCLAEGSVSVGATCGNSDIAFDASTLAGEECDDGNNSSGDGCSRQCLREGSESLASLGGALCGDGVVTTPYESCDDGNTNSGDGCSTICLREGLIMCTSATQTNCCGNAIVEQNSSTSAGEDCDGGEGCSAQCTLEGSSIEYISPSVCGDGTLGAGEFAQCEIDSVAGDGNIDADQVAYITKNAVYEVSTETQKAVAEITVTEPTSNLTATVDYTLSCAAENDQDCSDAVQYGVGLSHCCVARPQAVTMAPAGAAVCRNAALFAVFDTEMDIGSFTESVTESTTTTVSRRMYARLHLDTNETCPSSYTSSSTLAMNWWQRVLTVIRTAFLGPVANAASTTDCVVPVTSYSQTTLGDGTYKVSMNYAEALEPNATYTLVIEGDVDVRDTVTDGVRSALGVGMNGNQLLTFTTGSDICALDAVVLEDSDEESPGVFTSTNETHTYNAIPMSYGSGMGQEIAPLADVYDWTWSSWTSANTEIFSVTQGDASALDTAEVVAVGNNGDSTITATAKITADTTTATTGEVVTGTGKVTAYLCENTWPALGSFPWSDDAVGKANGFAAPGTSGYMNFSLSYCQDYGQDDDVTDDLPGMNVVLAPLSGSSGVLKEYLFEVDADSTSTGGNSVGDAIGVRVLSNPEYLSPMAWYEARGFTGQPTETTIDGFAAVTDDRSAYIAAANLGSAGLYSNIYVVSYNEGASEETQNIYEQILENISFLIQVADTQVCSVSGNACVSDLDCDYANGEGCGSDKLKIVRDTQRLSDLKDIALAVDAYGEENGSCSSTTSQSCIADSECPDSETCEAIVPTLASGTAVRGLVSSGWSSWTSTLGGALDENNLPVDPLNLYTICDGYSSETCVNATTGAYVCPVNSHVYHYRAVGMYDYEIATDLEYTAASWVNAVDDDSADNVTFYTASFCDGDIYGTSSSCGDGVIGINSSGITEVCELGDLSARSCLTDDGQSGTAYATCETDCSDYTLLSTATCTANSCGNGVIDGTEICDDGANNGEYGYCGSLCTWQSAQYCGDGVVSGGEACDCGDATAESSVLADARPYGGTSGSCVGLNGTYGANTNTTCAWDCGGPASYCGDDVIDSGEACDGNIESYTGKFCTDGLTQCTSDADCAAYGGTCGGSVLTGSCPSEGYVCSGGTYDGYLCNVPTWSLLQNATIDYYCETLGGGTCDTSGVLYQTSYTRSCDSSESTSLCGWNAWNYCNANGQSCGNGVVDGSEECDDGNDVATDGCTTACTVNVCGDGYLYDGSEECDEGTENGAGCDSAYGSSCSSCSTSCRYTVSSGEFCGDGVQNGDEYCDGTDIPYSWFDSVTSTTNGSCSVLGATTEVDSVIYTCRSVGMCNGGENNGEYCTQSNSLGMSLADDAAACAVYGGDCALPVCDASCDASCPASMTSYSLLMTSNQPGASPTSDIDLYSYDSSSTSSLPNAATITVPACTVAGNLLADVDFGNVTSPDVFVVFVTDTSGSMATALGSTTRMDVARESLNTAIDTLFTDLGDKAHIALVHYSSAVTLDMGFVESSYEADLNAKVNAYTASGSTETDDALDVAEGLLSGVDDRTDIDVANVSKIIVILSDGQPSSESATDAAALDILKTDGNELYSIALNTDTSLIEDMNRWSSNTICSSTASSITTDCATAEYNTENLLDYSYDGDSTTEVEGAYEQIVDSIVGGTAVLLSSSGGVVSVDRGSVGDAHNIELPWPTGFSCDGVSETEIPVQITFRGTGMVNISNVRLNACAP